MSKDLDSNIPSSFIHTSNPKLEMTQMPVSWGVDKWIVVNPYVAMLWSNDEDEFQERYGNEEARHRRLYTFDSICMKL